VGATGRPWERALAWLAFLGPFFFATYSLANWVASRRAGVGSLVYEWERAIPFEAWTIVPYWSIDAVLRHLALRLRHRARARTRTPGACSRRR
jgi:hypothetical protein